MCGSPTEGSKRRSALLTKIATEYNLKVGLTVIETMCTDVWAVAEFRRRRNCSGKTSNMYYL
jgi:hypothetical protein